MLLEKWYADVVDKNAVEVLYRANLRIGPVVIGYMGRLTNDGRAYSEFRPGGVMLPWAAENRVFWPAAKDEHPALAWNNSAPREVPLWHREKRRLSWNPFVLNGTVAGGGFSPAARGYLEKLTLNFGPWRLGMKRLKWGRFCGQEHSLVWIEWEGLHPFRLALLNGQACNLQDASRERISCSGASVRIGPLQVLVQESMATGALHGLPLTKRLTSLQFFRGIENKWFAPGVLSIEGREGDAGHVIFEEVTWP